MIIGGSPYMPYAPDTSTASSDTTTSDSSTEDPYENPMFKQDTPPPQAYSGVGAHDVSAAGAYWYA